MPSPASRSERAETALVAKSAPMRRLLELADRVARAEATVLVTGESGTGKERLAEYIHQRSRRRQAPFVAVNCGALPEPLLESELFGHKKGSFTGATDDAKGLFVAAKGGTLFLDEIGETPPALQIRLLRALQARTVRPVGSTQEVAIDVRIVAATNRDLDALVAEKTFRRDLYYRLRVVPLHVPPLRDRREDLLPLARAFIARACRDNHCGPCSLSSEVLDLLHAYDWPGNVRELEHAIERAVILAENHPTIRPEDLPPEIREGTGRHRNEQEPPILTLTDVERRHILDTLDSLGGNKKETARVLGIAENTLHRKLKSFGLPRLRAPKRRR